MFKVKANSLDFGNETKTFNKTFNNTSSTIPTNKLTKTTTTNFPINSKQYSSIRNFESTQSRLNSNPPIYYYRKVTNPYKYNIQKVDLKYSNKISDQENFTERVKKILDKESNGTITLDDIMSQTTRSNDCHLPYGFIYYDYLKKNPNILHGNDLTLNKRNIIKYRNNNLNINNTTDDRFYNYSERENNFSNIKDNYEIKNKNNNINDNNNNKEEKKGNDNENEENKEENDKKENEENNKENNQIKTENKIELNSENNIEENKKETETKKESNIIQTQETNNNPSEKTQENLIEKPKISTPKKEETENSENSNIKQIYPKLTQKEEIQYKYTQSDIFNLKKDNLFKNKSGEKYLFRPNKNQLDNKNKIYINYLSNSSWIPTIPNRSNYCGHTSVGYNIISPGKKSLFKTKEEIDRSSGIKLYNRIKAFSNFIDQNWQSTPHLTEQFSNSINDKKPFNRKKDIGGFYLDMHHTYREAIPHPFS